ncbi:MAG: hypothetical protein DRH17_01505 [Deltaproteobacteria bacterium]|nr:MAG: hypothetical protein DRH17_01505 [Deltaproteobacteria bacterium]
MWIGFGQRCEAPRLSRGSFPVKKNLFEFVPLDPLFQEGGSVLRQRFAGARAGQTRGFCLTAVPCGTGSRRAKKPIKQMALVPM